MTTPIGKDDSFFFYRKHSSSNPSRDLFNQKMKKADKSKEELEEDKEKINAPFPPVNQEIRPFNEQLPPHLSPSCSKGPAEASFATLRPNLSVPKDPPPSHPKKQGEQQGSLPPPFPPIDLNDQLIKSLEDTDSEPESKLPKAKAFWEELDMPDDPPPRRNLQEADQSTLQRPGEKKKKQIEDPTLQGLGQKKSSSLSEGPAQLPEQKKQKEVSDQEERPKKKLGHDQNLLSSVSQKKDREEHSHDERISFLPLPDQLPSSITPIIQNAQSVAAPYLNTKTEALFRQLVGAMIYIQNATPGISRTEVVLNGVSLQDSPFYNATVVIECYATAPDSFNITLHGSPQAVQIFNANLSDLSTAFTAAYDSKQIDFRINRLEVSLSSKWSGPGKKEKGEDESRSEDEE